LEDDRLAMLSSQNHVEFVRVNRANYASDNAAYRAISPRLGCSPDSLRARGQVSRECLRLLHREVPILSITSQNEGGVKSNLAS